MFDDEIQRDEHKKISKEIEILRRPFVGIVSGYHELGYRVLGPELDEKAGSVEIEGRLMVSPKLVWTPSEMQKTFGEIFEDEELMDTNLVGRVFAFPKVVTPCPQIDHGSLELWRCWRAIALKRASIPSNLRDGLKAIEMEALRAGWLKGPIYGLLDYQIRHQITALRLPA